VLSYDPAFQNTASCRSAVAYIDGDLGILRYRGYPIEELAENCSFLEVAWLLLNGELPTYGQMEIWEAQVKRHTMLHETTKKFLEGFRYDAHPMGMLISTVAALSTVYPEARNVHERANRRLQITRLIAKMPTICAYCYRHHFGLPYIYPDNDLSFTGNFMNMMWKMFEPKYVANQCWRGRSTSCSSCTPITNRTARPIPCVAWAAPGPIRIYAWRQARRRRRAAAWRGE